MFTIFLGAPGAGKGTQAKQLTEILGVPQISTGDMLRAAKASGSEFGQQIAAILEAGQLVSDDIILSLIAKRVAEPDAARGAIFDGFPRTVAQAEGLAALENVTVDHVVSINVPEERLLARLTGRRTCKSCSAMFHLEFKPPARVGVCDNCGGSLFQRTDDNEKSIKNRLAVYHESTAPLIDYYDAKGLLRNVDGTGAPGDVTARIKGVLGV